MERPRMTGTRRRRPVRRTSLLLLCALTATACGSRITQEQFDFVVSGGAGTGGNPGVVAPGPAGAGEPTAGASPAAGGAVAAPPTAGTQDQPATPQGDQPAGQQPAGDEGQAPQGSGGGGGGGGGQAPRDTRAAPAGGNGGETDVGVTADTITIANVADVSGAVPGLFEDTQHAVKAYIAMFSATEGTVYGRQLRYLPLDAQLSSGGNRNQYLRACEEAFAAVGSMSAFEHGAAPVIADCGIPDLRTASPTKEMDSLPQVHGVQVTGTAKRIAPIDEFKFFADQHPGATKKAAGLYIDVAIGSSNMNFYQSAAKKAYGYDWIYTQPIAQSESNYAPFVVEMKRRGVELVFFIGAYQQAVRLAEAMQTQSFKPKVFTLQANAYDPGLIQSGGEAVEGIQIPVPSVLVEEIDRHPELQRYAQWLNQVAPGQRPTGLGIYAWCAAKLFVDGLKQVGPELTREKMHAFIDEANGFGCAGIVPEQNVGSKVPTSCDVIVQVKGGRFVKVAPSSGPFYCTDPVKVG